MTKPRILIATPTPGQCPEAARVCYGYARLLRRIAQDIEHVDVLDPEEIDDVGYGTDLVRARSRIVHQAIAHARGYTHVLWWDSDVIVDDPGVLRAMLATGKDLIGAPYTRKGLRVDRVTKWINALGDKPVVDADVYAQLYDFPARAGDVDGPTTVRRDGDCLEVEGLGMGFFLTSTAALRALTARYREAFSFGIRGERMVALFQLVLPSERGAGPTGELLSEDYSFQMRAREAGFLTWCYVGPGTPLGHAGDHVFRGVRSGIIRG